MLDPKSIHKSFQSGLGKPLNRYSVTKRISDLCFILVPNSITLCITQYDASELIDFRPLNNYSRAMSLTIKVDKHVSPSVRMDTVREILFWLDFVYRSQHNCVALYQLGHLPKFLDSCVNINQRLADRQTTPLVNSKNTQ